MAVSLLHLTKTAEQNKRSVSASVFIQQLQCQMQLQGLCLRHKISKESSEKQINSTFSPHFLVKKEEKKGTSHMSCGGEICMLRTGYVTDFSSNSGIGGFYQNDAFLESSNCRDMQ